MFPTKKITLTQLHFSVKCSYIEIFISIAFDTLRKKHSINEMIVIEKIGSIQSYI